MDVLLTSKEWWEAQTKHSSNITIRLIIIQLFTINNKERLNSKRIPENMEHNAVGKISSMYLPSVHA